MFKTPEAKQPQKNLFIENKNNLFQVYCRFRPTSERKSNNYQIQEDKTTLVVQPRGFDG